MKKLISIGMMLVLGSVFALDYEGLGFVAPQINGSTNVDLPQKGEIIYDTDSSDKGFKGYSGSTWVSLEAGSVPNDMVRTPNETNPVIYSAFISGANGTGAVSNELGDFINGSCSHSVTGLYTCSFTSGAFASGSVPNCVAIVTGVDGRTATNPSTSTSSVSIRTTDGGTNEDNDFRIICHGLL